MKRKLDENGNIEKHKARLCGRGFSQILNEDYYETSAPVMRGETLCVLLHLAAISNWEVDCYDPLSTAVPIPTPYAHASSRPPLSPPSFVSHQHQTFIGLPPPDHVTSRGRDSALAQHRDNDSHTPPSLRPSSVVVTSDPVDVSTMVVTSEHWEVQHTTVLGHLYKDNTFCPIPTTLSCVLAFIANNKGTLNPPASQSAF
jgi:hypothetical protein